MERVRGTNRFLSNRSWKKRGTKTRSATVPKDGLQSNGFLLPQGSEIRYLLKKASEDASSETQQVILETDYPGDLVLHWGVEGGPRHEKQGWWLPDDKAWPEGTIMYKKRALQTPWKRMGNVQSLTITLEGDNIGNSLVFVLKDPVKGKWYDNNAGNFHVPLLDQEVHPIGAEVTNEGTEPMPDVPQDLAGVWSYLMWERSGCPERSVEEANLEYQAAIREIQSLMRKGYTVGDLQRACRGETVIQGSSISPKIDGKESQFLDQGPTEPEIPQELLNIQAYLLWEKAGKPQGADFGEQARSELVSKLGSGWSLEQIERSLKEPEEQEQEQLSSIAREVPEAIKEEVSVSESVSPAPKMEASEVESQPSVADPPTATSTTPVPPPPTAGSVDVRSLIRKPSPSAKSIVPDSAKNKTPLEPFVAEAAADASCKWRRLFNLGDKASLFVAAFLSDDGSTWIKMVSDCTADLVAHWGVSRDKSRTWEMPPPEVVPEGSAAANEIAMETPFQPLEGKYEIGGKMVPVQGCSFLLSAGHDLAGLVWVLRSEDSTRWWKDGDSNFRAPVPGGVLDVAVATDDALVQLISDAENSGAWTLMHRYNRVTDLLDGVLSGEFGAEWMESMVKLFVWLRFSSTRQLTWQRNYNTQPRILSAAQERLTFKIVEAYERSTGEAKEWARQMLACVGRGGEGQRVRDDILHIMHKNRIPELKGTWMEEWHQKLHNNTTPDDVGICEAYVAFLEENGDRNTYWRVLSDMGITRERLESFDRPIRCEPEDFPDKRADLIRDFREYLAILKSVHSAADLTHSVSAAGNSLSDEVKGILGYVLANRETGDVLSVMEAAVNARTAVNKMMGGNRDLMYLDLALEGLVRTLAERGAAQQGYSGALLGPLLQNLCLSVADNEEFVYCLMSWKGLPDSALYSARPSQEDALKAMAVVDRLRRALGSLSEIISERIQPLAESLGRAFGVEEWNIQLFAEETIRGSSAFAVSLVLTQIESSLRSAAKLSAWQVISPSHARGVVELVPDLHVVQEKVYETPTVLISERVTGEEEVPEGVVGVVTPDAPDVLSHIAVRARNMKVFLATCYERSPIDELAQLAGKAISIKSTAAGEVSYHETKREHLVANESGSMSMSSGDFLTMEAPKWCGKYTLQMDEFGAGKVGAKSKNLAGLRGKLPDWINLPPSVTLPFGSFEEVLNHPSNAAVKKELEVLKKRVRDAPIETLAACRSAVMKVSIPSDVKMALDACMKQSGLQWPDGEERWEEAFIALRKVWASKYNDRAYFSMKKVGLNMENLRMAVLVQRVVPAKYAFVIHTKNPSTGNEQEIYAEIVCGLGETLVGNYPGRALAFTAQKQNLKDIHIESYPSKSVGLFCPESLIFRSDSNGEDLEGYAGAGLYDSITMDSTFEQQVDYSTDPLVTDQDFMHDLCFRVASVGKAIEDALGSAQDVEGAVESNGSITVVQTRPQV